MHIHAIDIYDNGEYLSGMEMNYLVDGDVMKYVPHHKILRLTKQEAKVANPLRMLSLNINQKNTTDEDH